MRLKNNGIHILPKTIDMDQTLDKLITRQAILVDTNIARAFSRYKKIRLLREKNHLFIGWDRDKHKSIIYRPPQVKIKRSSNGFFIDFF